MAIVFKTPKSTLNTTSKAIQNLGGDCPPCPEPVLESASEEYTSNGEYTITPEQGVDGFSSVDITVNVPSDVNNQNKTVSPTTSSQTVEADSGYSGLGTVTVNAVTSAIDQNIAAGNIKKDVSILGVTGNYDPQPTLSNLNITPSTNSQEYNPAISGVDGYSLVRVNAVTASIDANIQSENILSGVTILGVTGSDEGYDAGYTAGETDGEAAGYQSGYDDGYSAGQSECPTPVFEQLNVTPTTSAQQIFPVSGDGFDEVNVSSVTAAIDANIAAGNIKNGVSILGVTGNVVEAELEEREDFVVDMVGNLHIEPSEDYNGLAYVNGVVESDPIGGFWNPFDAVDIDRMEQLYEWQSDGVMPGMEACFYMDVESGSIDSETGLYVAEDANGSVFNIEPYLSNPDYDSEQEDDPIDNPQLIFPENFDLSGLNIQVYSYLPNVIITRTEPENPGGDPSFSIELPISTINGINWNSDMESWPLYWDGTLSGSIEASTRNLSLSTNELSQMSIASPEPWEIEIDQPQSQMNVSPLTKSGLRSAAPTLEIDQMEGNAGVFTLNVLSTEDQNTGFTIRGLNSGNELHIDVESFTDYLYIQSLEDSNVITWNTGETQGPNIEFSLDNGETWSVTNVRSNGLPVPYEKYVYTWTLNTDDIILFRNKYDGYESCKFESTKTFNVGGILNSLIDYEDINTPITKPKAFKGLFSGSKVVDAGSLVMPEFISTYCFDQMFSSCQNLISAPDILPAKVLTDYCYNWMFYNCASLENAPELPAVVLASNCYNQMFGSCIALETAPELPAEHLINYCYSNMFAGCTSLTQSPILPAKEITNNGAYYYMFSNCTNLEVVTCLATSVHPNGITNWLNGVAAEGTFYKDENMTGWTVGTNVPTGWTVEDYVA